MLNRARTALESRPHKIISFWLCMFCLAKSNKIIRGLVPRPLIWTAMLCDRVRKKPRKPLLCNNLSEDERNESKGKDPACIFDVAFGRFIIDISCSLHQPMVSIIAYFIANYHWGLFDVVEMFKMREACLEQSCAFLWT